MVRGARLLLTAALLVLWWSGPSASARVRLSTPICPLTEVRAGQRAVGKSVFRGTHIETFNLEIIGVLRKFEGTRSVILARVLDGTVVKRQSGVVGGMSGSPVYIKGRLAGAIALGWTFSKEPIVGITPIEEMLEAWEEGSTTAPPPSRAGTGFATSVVVGGRRITQVRIGGPDQVIPDPPGVMTLTPLGGVVQVSGFSERAVRRMSEALAPYGLRVCQAPGGGEERLSPPIVPGAAVGAQLVSGDFDISGLGTVTLVEGDRVLAFGHPLLQLGKVDLPLTGGYVYDILPNVYMSDKIMAPTRPVGVIYRDHQTAIAGRLGGQADLLPVTIEVSDLDARRTRKFSLRLARIRELTPVLAAVSAMTACDETRGRVTRGTARTVLEIEAEGRPTLRREEWVYDDSDASAAMLPAVMEPLALFTDHYLGSLKIKALRIHVETVEARQTALIERLRVASSRVKAGDKVMLIATIRPHGKDPVEVPLEFTLPPDLAPGSVRVVVTSGNDADSARASLGAPLPRPVSLDQLVRRYLSRGSSRDLVVQAALGRRSAALLGEELPDLPPGALNALRATRPTDLRSLTTVLRVVKPTEWVLSGTQTVVLQVDSVAARPRGGAPAAGEEEEPGAEEGEEPAEEEQPEEVPDFTLQPAASDLGWFPLAAETAREPERGKEKAEERKEQPPSPKALTKAPDTWVHSAMKDYERARLDSVAVRADGRLALSLNHRVLARLPAEVVWSIAVGDGVAYVGTGTKGKIFRVSSDGEVSEFFATGEMNVHSLMLDESGNLYAGTSPGAKVFRITPEGKGEVIYQADGTYVWRLARGPEGKLYAASGAPARVHVIDLAATARPTGRTLAELPATNAVALAVGPSGALYVGTSGAGVVYRVGPDGGVTTVCRLPGASVEAMAADADGGLFAAATPGGEIYRMPWEGPAGWWSDTQQAAVYGLAAMGQGTLVAATGPQGLVIRIGPDGQGEVIFRPEAGVATAIAAAGGAVYVGLSAPAELHVFGPGYAASGLLESAPLDAERPAVWGRFEWVAEVPEGTRVMAETRSGNSPHPDDHWSEWQTVEGGLIRSPAARYLQYRLTLATDNPQVTPQITALRISRRADNRPPTCTIKGPQPGQAIAKKYTVKWEAKDPDRDTLNYELAASSDQGKTWKELKKGLSATQYEWDTTQHPDGRYLLRVRASDGRSRPDRPRSADAVVPVVVDNTPPKVVIFRSSVSVGEDRVVRLKGMASDALSPIWSIEYRVDGGTWQALPLPMIESSLSDFAVTTDALPGGRHRVEVRGFDAAGNMASDQVEVKVEGPPAPAAQEQEATAQPEEEPAAGETEAGVEESTEAGGEESAEETGEEGE